MPTTPNHAPTPAVEGATSPGMPPETCAEIKARYGITSGTHSDNKEANKGTGSGKQSHHILQGAATNDLLDYNQAMAVLLANSHGGTTHQITTARQNERRDNKALGRSGTKPATNFGDLKKLSKEDLVESFKSGENMPPEDAEKLADCLVAEAEEKVKKDALANKRIKVNDSTPVLQTGGCLPADTLVWLDDHNWRRLDALQCGELVAGLDGQRAIARFDHCINDLVRLWVGEASVSLAPFHRVLTEQGRFERADSLRMGQWVQAHEGAVQLSRVEHDRVPQPVVSIGVAADFECRIGVMGLWIELPDTGVVVHATTRLHPALTGAGAADTAHV